METLMKFRKAFEAGLKAEFGDLVGEVLSDAVGFFPSVGLKPEALRTMVQEDTTTIAPSINAGTVDGGTLLKIRSNMLASAILKDAQGIRHWSGVGREWCQKVDGGGWKGTAAEWEWVSDNADEYSKLVSALKQFLNQR